MKHLVAAATFCAMTALAPLGASAQPATPMPMAMPKGMVMMTIVQTRPDRVGDRYSYVAETRRHMERGGKIRDDGDRQSFDIEVLKVGSQGLTLRYTQTKAEAFDPDDKARQQALLDAFNGVAVDFETTPNGYPVRVVDEAGVRTALIAAMSRADPDHAQQFTKALGDMPSQVFVEQAVGDKLVMIGAMQFRGPLKFGHENLAGETHTDADGTVVTVHKTADVLPAEGACRVQIVRKTWTERPGGATIPGSSLETQAVLAEADGWVLDLTETSKISIPGAQQTKTVKITRGPANACPKG